MTNSESARRIADAIAAMASLCWSFRGGKLTDMASATYNSQTIADSDDIELVEGNVYFAPGDVDATVLVESTHTSQCFWKGTANYFHVRVGDQQTDNAAWTYTQPKPRAAHLAGRIAFWKDVTVQR